MSEDTGGNLHFFGNLNLARCRFLEDVNQQRVGPFDSDSGIVGDRELVDDLEVVNCGSLCVEDCDALGINLGCCLVIEAGARSLLDAGVICNPNGRIESVESQSLAQTVSAGRTQGDNQNSLRD